MGWELDCSADLKSVSVSLRSPLTRVMLDDLAANRWADGELGSRVTARMGKPALSASKALMSAPPCLPVAPVTRIARFMAEDVEVWFFKW